MSSALSPDEMPGYQAMNEQMRQCSSVVVSHFFTAKLTVMKKVYWFENVSERSNMCQGR